MSTQTVSIGAEDLIEVGQVAGDLLIEGREQPELEARGDQVHIEKRMGSVVISCNGDLVLSVPHGCHLAVRSIGGDARLQNLGGAVELGLVGGDAILQNLTGPVSLNGVIGGDTRLENVVNVSMTANKMGPEFGVADHLRRKVEQAARRAESKVRRAEHRTFQHTHARGHQADSARWKYHFAQEPSVPGAAGEPVSDEERLMILRMLHEQKITSEQAEKLLAALEESV